MTGDEAQAVARSLAGLSPAVLQRIVLQSGEAVLVTDADNRIVAANAAFLHLSGYPLEELLGAGPQLLASGRNPPEFYAAMWQSLRESGLWSGEIWDRRKDGNVYPAWLTISEVRDGEGRLTHHVASFADIGERVEATQKLLHLAYHDPLTGLPNRLAFESQIDLAIRSCERDHKQVALMLIDLDHFKAVNDTLGHAIGDELLKRVAVSLRECVRASDIVVRLGGDEFVVVIGRLQSADDLSIVAGKILRSLNQPFIMEGKEIFVTASVGAALYPRDGDHGEILLRNADVAMYRVKEHGRNNYRFYTPEMTHMAIDRLDMEGNLRRALERDELQVYYQPLVDLSSGTIVGAEALVRWSHPRIGMIQPGEFIPLAEDTGLIIPLGQLVLRRVCTDIRDWQASGLPPIKISLNLSARQFRQDDLSACIREVLDETGVEGRLLAFELTESMVMHDVENTLDTLRELKALGATISLDDFGTGYSSLSYLKRFPIDTLKIDRSFVRDIHQDGDDAAIAHAVIAMAHKLGIKVIAEGVECPAQLDLLREFGCDELQGYYFSRPVPVEEFTLMLRQARSLADLERG